MKKILALLTIVGILLTSTINTNAVLYLVQEDAKIPKVVKSPFSVTVEGVKVCNSVLNIDGRSYLTVRALGEALNLKVLWNGKASPPIITLTENYDKPYVVSPIDIPDGKIDFKFTNIRLFIYNEQLKSEKVVIVNERSYMPLRAIAEALGCEVGWDSDTGSITVNRKNGLLYAEQN